MWGHFPSSQAEDMSGLTVRNLFTGVDGIVLWRGWCRSFHDIYISLVLFNVVFVSQWCSIVICNNVKCLFVYKNLGLWESYAKFDHELIHFLLGLYPGISNSGLENSLPRDDSDEDFGEASLSGQEDTDGSEAVLAWAEVCQCDIILSLTHLYVGGQMLVKSTSKTLN